MKSGSVEVIVHLGFALALLAAYTVLRIFTGESEDILLGVLVGQGGALSIQKFTTGTPPTPE